MYRPARGGRSCERFGGYKTINRIPLPFTFILGGQDEAAYQGGADGDQGGGAWSADHGPGPGDHEARERARGHHQETRRGREIQARKTRRGQQVSPAFLQICDQPFRACLKDNSYMYKTEAQIVSYGILYLNPSSHQCQPSYKKYIAV